LYKNPKPHTQCVLDVCCSVAVDLFILLLLLLQRSSTEIRRSSSVKLLCMGGVLLCMCVCFSLGLESGGFDESRRKGAPYKRKRFVCEAFLLSFLFWNWSFSWVWMCFHSQIQAVDYYYYYYFKIFFFFAIWASLILLYFTPQVHLGVEFWLLSSSLCGWMVFVFWRCGLSLWGLQSVGTFMYWGFSKVQCCCGSGYGNSFACSGFPGHVVPECELLLLGLKSKLSSSVFLLVNWGKFCLPGFQISAA